MGQADGCWLLAAEAHGYKEPLRMGSGNGKGKVYPITGHEGQNGEQKYGTLSLTSVLNGVGWSTPRSGRFTPGKDPVSIV